MHQHVWEERVVRIDHVDCSSGVECDCGATIYAFDIPDCLNKPWVDAKETPPTRYLQAMVWASGGWHEAVFQGQGWEETGGTRVYFDVRAYIVLPDPPVELQTGVVNNERDE